MPSKKHSKPQEIPKPAGKMPNPQEFLKGSDVVQNEQDIEAFIALNQQSLAELVTFIDFVDERLTIGFVEVNFAKDRDVLIELLQVHPQCEEVQFEICDFSDANLRFLRDAIVEKLASIKRVSSQKLLLLIVGLEHAIGMVGEYPPVLQDLNFVRDAFIASVPHPILLFLPDYALTRLAKYAPDFWAWRAGIFHFKTAQLTKEKAIDTTLEYQKILGSLNLEEEKERIDLLQRLMMEYYPSNHRGTAADLPGKINILHQLGVAYRSIGEVKRSQYCLEEALALIGEDEDLNQIKAMVLHSLGYLYDDLGEIEQAIALYQQSLELKERIGNLEGKAATLHQLAGIYTDRGEIEQAIAFYQQSLELFERIGDVQGKAATLAMLGQLLADEQGDFDTAVEYLQQSLAILQRLRSAQAETVQRILARVILSE